MEKGREMTRGVKRTFYLTGFLTSSPATRLYCGSVPRLTSDNFRCCHTRDRVSGETMTSVSTSHITMTLTLNPRRKKISLKVVSITNFLSFALNSQGRLIETID